MIRLYQQFRIERPDGSVDIRPLEYRHTEKSMEDLMALVTIDFEVYRINFTRVFFLPEDGVEYDPLVEYIGDL